ncbi:hypothetical protein NCS55_01497300 [Fusarium keratoplasticum]|nr:hypothetical protein NCS55_01497300 [Fusarium keratoplasticum]
MPAVNAIIVGAGPAGISMAYRLKHDLNFHDFTMYDKLDGPGGTWRANTYPGCGCDLKSNLYSFSFNPNPNWSKELCEQPEILQYMEDTVDKFDIRKHIHESVECLGSEWDKENSHWIVNLKDLRTEIEYTRTATILISAVGAISFPRDVRFQGMDKFAGHMFHTARWNHNVSWKDKRVAVIGNGCSAAQVVPAMAEDAAVVKQYARSGQWFHNRPNRDYTWLEKFLNRWMPLYQLSHRLAVFLEADEETTTYFSTKKGFKARHEKEEESKAYIRSKVPDAYAKHLIPKFPLGCKRRIFDPGYLDSLNRHNVELIPEGIREMTETGIISSSGKEDEYDIIVLATGFQVSEFLTPMHIVGSHGVSLHDQWKQCRGAQAYLGTHVHNFPNLGILFGPNTFPANNSALFACETQAVYAVKSLFEPILSRRAAIVEVKQAAEDRTTNAIHHQLGSTVFAGDCSNWYIGKYGRNAASWPGLARSFWWATFTPNWVDFELTGASPLWPLYALARRVRNTFTVTKLAVLLAVMVTVLGYSNRLDWRAPWLALRGFIRA